MGLDAYYNQGQDMLNMFGDMETERMERELASQQKLFTEGEVVMREEEMFNITVERVLGVIEEMERGVKMGYEEYGGLEDSDYRAFKWVLDMIKTRIQQLQDEEEEAGEYLVMRVDTCVGNSALFWRPDSAGYTCSIDKAGRYTEERAMEIQGDGSRDIAVPAEVAIRCARRHVDMCEVRNAVTTSEEVSQ